ncbi:MAG: hypothetical protein IIA10_11490 [Proteobacteria bacterium]|nr:hypothetical protein [Pseudomonadota bacterium]
MAIDPLAACSGGMATVSGCVSRQAVAVSKKVKKSRSFGISGELQDHVRRIMARRSGNAGATEIISYCGYKSGSRRSRSAKIPA